jgi:dienelactone hydrolase/lysophospholipase L1-like esterase
MTNDELRMTPSFSYLCLSVPSVFICVQSFLPFFSVPFSVSSCLRGEIRIPMQAQNAEENLPRIVLIGDSIRLGYAPLVAERLKGRAVVVSPSANGGDSGNVLKHLEEWVIREKPQVVHLNCGLHDLKLDKQTKKHQVELGPYEANLREIVSRIRKETQAVIVCANTTPIHDQRHGGRGANFDRFQADVERYNAAAESIMREAGVPVHDLHWLVQRNDPEKMLLRDGTHYTPEGYARLAEAVSDCLLRQLTVLRPRSLSSPASGAEAAAAYRKTEMERDALVPSAYRNLQVGTFRPPASADVWKAERPEVLRKVRDSLGDLPPRPSPQQVRVVSRELRPGYTLERVAINNGVDGEVSALLLVPTGLKAPAPAVMWLHSSTPDKNQVLTPNTFWGEAPLGETLVRAGYVVLAPDAYWHGDRAGTGPAGRAETAREEHESLFKLHLWLGRTLWGMFVRDDQIALDYLCSRPEVDPKRIGATGMSMGSTRAWWLAAVDERLAAAVGIACLTRYQNLIAHGQLRQHGVYYFTNGLLKHFDSEAVVALIAPRPFLALTGELDAGSPADGVRAIEQQAGKVYSALGAPERFRSVLYPEVGHTVTPEMRREMLDWFARWLKP